MLSKYPGVLSDIGLIAEFQILSDRTKYCQTRIFILLNFFSFLLKYVNKVWPYFQLYNMHIVLQA